MTDLLARRVQFALAAVYDGATSVEVHALLDQLEDVGLVVLPVSCFSSCPDPLRAPSGRGLDPAPAACSPVPVPSSDGTGPGSSSAPDGLGTALPPSGAVLDANRGQIHKAETACCAACSSTAREPLASLVPSESGSRAVVLPAIDDCEYDGGETWLARWRDASGRSWSGAGFSRTAAHMALLRSMQLAGAA